MSKEKFDYFIKGGCTELPIAIFAYKSFKKIKQSKVCIDRDLLLGDISMKKYKKF